MKTIDKQDNNTDSEEIAKENEANSSKKENNDPFIQLEGNLTITMKAKGIKRYLDYCKKSKDENQKLTTASNILIALSGVFITHDTMNKEQFEQIVHSLVASE